MGAGAAHDAQQIVRLDAYGWGQVLGVGHFRAVFQLDIVVIRFRTVLQSAPKAQNGATGSGEITLN